MGSLLLCNKLLQNLVISSFHELINIMLFGSGLERRSFSMGPRGIDGAARTARGQLFHLGPPPGASVLFHVASPRG